MQIPYHKMQYQNLGKIWYGIVQDEGRSVTSPLPGQAGRHFADNIFRCIFVNEIFVR